MRSKCRKCRFSDRNLKKLPGGQCRGPLYNILFTCNISFEILSFPAYLVSFLNLLQGVQNFNNNHLLLGANWEEDHPLLKKYTEHLAKEMEEIDGKCLKTERGHEVIFKFELIPADKKWVTSIPGAPNNGATYFASFANVSQDTKTTMGGSIWVHSTEIWKPWNYNDRVKMVEKVENYKKKAKGSVEKERSNVTAFISY